MLAPRKLWVPPSTLPGPAHKELTWWFPTGVLLRYRLRSKAAVKVWVWNGVRGLMLCNLVPQITGLFLEGEEYVGGASLKEAGR